MRTKYLTASIVVAGGISLFLFAPFDQPIANSTAEAKSDQVSNFNEDVSRAADYWAHNKRGSAYYRGGDYQKSIEEYKKAIQIIESEPEQFVRTDVSKEYRDSVNRELKVSSQIFSRYGLIEALTGAGRYDEALQNVYWLMQNQIMKGKEEFLKQKLEGMKQVILQKKIQSV